MPPGAAKGQKQDKWVVIVQIFIILGALGVGAGVLTSHRCQGVLHHQGEAVVATYSFSTTGLVWFIFVW